MLRRFLPIIGVFFLLLFRVAAQGAAPQFFDYNWAQDRDAKGYLAEIQDLNGNQVVNQYYDARVHSARFLLRPGTYRLHLTVIDRWGRSRAMGPWTIIQVGLAQPPAVGQVPRLRLMAGSSAVFNIPVAGFARDGMVSVVAPSRTQIVCAFAWLSASLIQVTLPPLVERGNYLITLTNPPDQSTTITGALTVQGQLPQVSSVYPPVVEASPMPQSFQITGSGFSPNIQVFLQSPNGSVFSLPVSLRSDNVIGVVLPSQIPPAVYRLLVSNSNEEPQVDAGQFVVQMPRQRGVIIEQGPVIISPRQQGPIILQPRTQGTAPILREENRRVLRER